MIEILDAGDNPQMIEGIARDHNAIDVWHHTDTHDGRPIVRVLCESGHDQELLDALQDIFSADQNWRMSVYPVETTMPLDEAERDRLSSLRKSLSREELFQDIQAGSRLDSHFVMLVVLSTIVAAIGLLQDNVAVIIGAMVIAPLLGPNLALSYGAAMGDRDLIMRSIKSLGCGVAISLGLCFVVGLMSAQDMTQSNELMARTKMGYDVPILALASGAAAVLSMTGGVSSALVGVMVAVALLPPTAAAGLLAGAGYWGNAALAFLFLITNIVCVNLAAQIVLVSKGIKPRTWLAKRSAKQSIKVTFMFWGGFLALIIALISLLRPVLE